MIKRIRASSINSKMSAMGLIGLLGLAFILFGMYTYFRQIESELTNVQQVDFPVVRVANELRVGVGNLNQLYQAAVVEVDEDTLAEASDLAAEMREKIVSIGQNNPELAAKSDMLLKSFDEYINVSHDYSEKSIASLYSSEEMFGVAGLRAMEKRDIYKANLNALAGEIDHNFAETMEALRSDASTTFRSQFTSGILLALILVLAFISIIRMIREAIRNVIGVAGEIARGNLDVEVDHGGSSQEFQHLFNALEVMRNRLKEQNLANEMRQNKQTRVAKLNDSLRGELDVSTLGSNILRCMAELTSSLGGAFYTLQGAELVVQARYAPGVGVANLVRFKVGETLVGQAAQQKRLQVIADLPENFSPLESGVGRAAPGELLLAPLVINDKLLGVLELLSFRAFKPDEIEFVREGCEAMAIALNSALSREQLADALDRTRQQAVAMEQQQEELRTTNEELAEQAAILRASEENLQAQQEELRVMNEELEERNAQLDLQKQEIERSNAELEVSRADLQAKARQLEESGRYKSEFLSTMSHELRTPLNSILILSQGLMDNRLKTLTDKQVEHARVINSSGRDLLMLINDILDLSKVEEGKFELVIDEMKVQEFGSGLQVQFETQAETKGVKFNVSIDPRLPPSLAIDEHRLSQILRNFISNALKFTHEGSVDVHVGVPQKTFSRLDGVTLKPEDAVVFSVKDSGIGIPKDKQALIFEAFQQVDGTISRKYGGTGLGLTISKKLADLMGGGITVESEGEGKGSQFNLIVPRRLAEPASPVQGAAEAAATVRATHNVAPEVARTPPAPAVVALPAVTAVTPPVPDEFPVEPALLIVEDNPGFSTVLNTLATEFGFTTVCVQTAADAFRYLERHVPASVILDLGLPDAPGESLLEFLKGQDRTRHVPVHVISGNPNVEASSLPGAREFIAKPFGRDRLDQLFQDIGNELNQLHERSVLVIEDDPVQCEAIEQTFREKEIPCDMAESGAAGRARLDAGSYGAIIVDLDLPDCDGFKLVEDLRHHANANATPIIVYTARDLTKRQDADLRRYATRIVLKTDRSLHRLLNETTLFLHWLKGNEVDKLPATPVTPEAPVAEGDQRLLLVDDDIRNLYSLSAVLEECGWEVRTAGTGREALDVLAEEGAFDLVLMDIMMPEMDGFEAMRRIREDERFARMPIIALTAKAMRDDRARCIEAGANDYLSKPVDNGKLKAIVKMWLAKS